MLKNSKKKFFKKIILKKKIIIQRYKNLISKKIKEKFLSKSKIFEIIKKNSLKNFRKKIIVKNLH